MQPRFCGLNRPALAFIVFAYAVIVFCVDDAVVMVFGEIQEIVSVFFGFGFIFANARSDFIIADIAAYPFSIMIFPNHAKFLEVSIPQPLTYSFRLPTQGIGKV